MLFSWQTYEGFQITCKSISECVSFLLSKGMELIWLNLSAKILWNTLATSAKLGAGQKIQIYFNLDTKITLYPSNAKFHIFQAKKNMGGMIRSVAGKLSLMICSKTYTKQDIRLVIYYHTPNSMSFVSFLDRFSYYIIIEWQYINTL